MGQKLGRVELLPTVEPFTNRKFFLLILKFTSNIQLT